jgi:hypothetical protein
MKYSCDHCPYETDKKANYLRHINRKFKCNNRCIWVTPNASEVTLDASEVTLDASEVTPNASEVTLCASEVTLASNLACDKCKRIFSRKNILYNHQLSCTGLSSLQCEICHKTFTCKQHKYRHKRNVVCHPPPPSQPDFEPSENKNDETNERSLLTVHENEDCRIINSNTNNNNDNSQTHNTNNSHNMKNSHNTNNINIKVENNNNFAYNYLGNEDVSYVSNKPNVLQTLKSYGKKGIYGIGDIINSIICNPEHPENSTLLKPKEYGTDVLVRDCNDSNKLEFRDISDAMETIKNKALPRYLQGVCNYIKNNNITRLPDLKEKALLRKLIHIMIVLDIDVPEELENIVDIDDDKVDQDRSNEALCSSHNTKLNKSVARSAYEFTKQNYKKKNGTYVMKK